MTYLEAIKQLLNLKPILINFLVSVIELIKSFLVLLISTSILFIRLILITILPISGYFLYLIWEVGWNLIPTWITMPVTLRLN